MFSWVNQKWPRFPVACRVSLARDFAPLVECGFCRNTSFYDSRAGRIRTALLYKGREYSGNLARFSCSCPSPGFRPQPQSEPSPRNLSIGIEAYQKAVYPPAEWQMKNILNVDRFPLFRP